MKKQAKKMRAMACISAEHQGGGTAVATGQGLWFGCGPTAPCGTAAVLPSFILPASP